MLELELGQKLNDFHNGKLSPQWKDFNTFLEWYFEISAPEETVEIQPDILKLQELGKMPDYGTVEMPELSGRYVKLLEQVKTPINYQEAEILVKLFPENSLC